MHTSLKSLLGKKFAQENVKNDLANTVAGHQKLTKIVLYCLVLVLCLFGAAIIEFLSAFLTINILIEPLNTVVGRPVGYEELVFIESGIIGLVVIASMIFAITERFVRSIVADLILGIVLVGGVFITLKSQDQLPSEFFLTVVSGLLVSLVVSYLSFFVIRLADALADVILVKSQLLKCTALLLMLPLAMVCTQTVISTLVVDEPFKKILLALSDTQLNQVRFITTVVATLSIWAFAWGARLANRRRGVPWHYPDILRSLALTIGSWRSTSFHNLDLSHVSFRNAKLANADLRARKLYRTNFRGVTGLKRARVDNRYLDLALPKVQKLLTHGASDNSDYSRLNLQGAFLQGCDLRRLQFIDTNLTGADLRDADLRGAILARTQMIDTDFSNANLTGICIQDWSVNEQTLFTNVLCDYVYRELDEKGESIDRYPADRNFEPQEFESLYQELGNVAELVFKEGVNWRAFSFSMQKLDLEDDGLGLELKGFERRGDRWVVRVTHNQFVPKQEVESRLIGMYDEMKGLLAAKEEQIHQLLGIASDQAESIKELSQKPFGNSFFITGSTITNLTGSGNIEYTEAAHQVREMVIHGSDRKQLAPIVNQFAKQLKQQAVATQKTEQLELIQQLIVAEAEADPEFREYLLKESQQILQAMAGTPLTQVIQGAVKVLLPRQ
ncbi:MAG: pentapeptide repeat-containing protein [Leptolyngbya sp. SIO3F4]|nr:pentapeptide repeat-containing protein [Leptolyngbya sp. SIO3F4]